MSDLAVLTIWGGVALFVFAVRLCALMGTTLLPRRFSAGVSPRAFLRAFRRPALMLAAVLVALSPLSTPGGPGTDVAWADSAWLTDPLSLGQPVAPWNAAGRPVPAAPPPANPASAATAPRQIQALCGDHYRPPETAEDAQVVAAGWTPMGGLTSGWDVRVVRGVTDVDEKCRPVIYQDLVFVGGLFAGTVSPTRLTWGEDGDLWSRALASPNHLVAQFAQYYPETPQCCPAGVVALDLQLQRPGGPAVVVPGRAVSAPAAPPATAYAGDAEAVTAEGGGAWLNALPGAWNQIGASVPGAPAGQAWPAACSGLLRAPQTDADNQVAGAGWALLGGYESGWGLTVVHGVTGADAQCRPRGYQAFVFVDGVYAGTAAPQAMDAGTDGALVALDVVEGDQLAAVFQRYEAGDPAGAPAGRTRLDLGIARTSAGPLVTPLGPPPPG